MLCVVPHSSALCLQCFMVSGHEHHCVHSHTLSFWKWVSLVNGTSDNLKNKLYDQSVHKGLIHTILYSSFPFTALFFLYQHTHTHCSLLRPLYFQTCLALWRTHYEKETVKMVRQREKLDCVCVWGGEKEREGVVSMSGSLMLAEESQLLNN